MITINSKQVTILIIVIILTGEKMIIFTNLVYQNVLI